MYKNNSRFSSKFKGFNSLQICDGSKVETPTVGYYFNTSRSNTLQMSHIYPIMCTMIHFCQQKLL